MEQQDELAQELQKVYDLLIKHRITRRIESTHITAYWLNDYLARLDIKVPD